MDNIIDYENERSFSVKQKSNNSAFLVSFLVLGVLNILFFVWVIPYAQKNINNHVGNETLVLILIFILFTITGIGLFKLIQKRITVLIAIGFLINLLYWLYELEKLECYHCSLH